MRDSLVALVTKGHVLYLDDMKEWGKRCPGALER